MAGATGKAAAQVNDAIPDVRTREAGTAAFLFWPLDEALAFNRRSR
ncbi:hypothetical protein X766_11530 [Mesorhizobium sp. LSJC255A00]|nr:hypothetical protein X766_11530 [Mesorhizobium sp. LSJC255A00]